MAIGGALIGGNGLSGAKLREVPWRALVAGMGSRVASSARALASKQAPRDQRTHKKLGMMRLSLQNRVASMHARAKAEVDPAFIIEAVDLVRRMEESIEQYEHDLEAWREFINVLEARLAETGLITDEEMAEQAKRLTHAITRLKTKIGED